MKNLTAKQMFKPIQSGKVAQNIRCQIEDAILSGEISLGEKVPPARELQHVFQASRSSDSNTPGKGKTILKSKHPSDQ